MKQCHKIALSILFCIVLGMAFPTRAGVVDLAPHGETWWGVRDLVAPFASIFVGPMYYYGKRELRIDTVPPAGTLDLFYIRASFQKRYERTQAPATVILPRRIDASPRDVVLIRASLEGYREQERTVQIASREDKVQINFEPLPNTLRAVAHTYLAGRASLTFLTDEVLNIRIQKDATEGYTVFLNATAKAPGVGEALQSLRSAWIDSLRSQQLGEDLLIRIKLSEIAKKANLELRSRQAHDPYRDIQTYTLDLIAPDEQAMIAAVKVALIKVTPIDVTDCSFAFEDGLHEGLTLDALNRALAPRGEFTDPYLQAAMKRLGEVSPGKVITLQDGTQLSPDNVLELTLAMSQPAQVRGYLAFLRSFSRHLEGQNEWRSTLRGLIAPEIGATTFNEILDRATARERSCMLRKIGAAAPELQPFIVR